MRKSKLKSGIAIAVMAIVMVVTVAPSAVAQPSSRLQSQPNPIPDHIPKFLEGNFNQQMTSQPQLATNILTTPKGGPVSPGEYLAWGNLAANLPEVKAFLESQRITMNPTNQVKAVSSPDGFHNSVLVQLHVVSSDNTTAWAEGVSNVVVALSKSAKGAPKDFAFAGIPTGWLVQWPWETIRPNDLIIDQIVDGNMIPHTEVFNVPSGPVWSWSSFTGVSAPIEAAKVYISYRSGLLNSTIRQQWSAAGGMELPLKTTLTYFGNMLASALSASLFIEFAYDMQAYLASLIK